MTREVYDALTEVLDVLEEELKVSKNAQDNATTNNNQEDQTTDVPVIHVKIDMNISIK